jgi:anti-sigma B factor antagonist
MRLLEPEISVARVGESLTVVSVHGELDLDAAGELRDALEGATEDGRLIVDLVGTTFIDSTALGVIAGAAKAGANLTVVASDPRIVRIFQLTGLDRSITVERSLAEAIAHRLVP